MAAIAITGLSTGALHALSGPDHVLSLAPLSLNRPPRAWRIGLTWGVGHALGTLLVALPLLWLLGSIASIAHWADRAAGLALIATGVAGLRRVRVAAADRAQPTPSTRALLGVGFVHGVTGAAALLLLLPGAASGAALTTALYLAAFGLGSALAMAALTAALARTGAMVARFRVWAPAASIVLGGCWLCGL